MVIRHTRVLVWWLPGPRCSEAHSHLPLNRGVLPQWDSCCEQSAGMLHGQAAACMWARRCPAARHPVGFLGPSAPPCRFPTPHHPPHPSTHPPHPSTHPPCHLPMQAIHAACRERDQVPLANPKIFKRVGNCHGGRRCARVWRV